MSLLLRVGSGPFCIIFDQHINNPLHSSQCNSQERCRINNDDWSCYGVVSEALAKGFLRASPVLSRVTTRTGWILWRIGVPVHGSEKLGIILLDFVTLSKSVGNLIQCGELVRQVPGNVVHEELVGCASNEGLDDLDHLKLLL
ncbi:hypothetical protein PVK06_003375 [Gossypium arboreum]|uniref:Uncharacterized protein n=1 Tax=Gossypium arboreum TaxID=29729 RepID=A0ABR0R7J8_GOSAR|nr:hypothetical protein PVK06_003375 [Gossypium arboreum]